MKKDLFYCDTNEKTLFGRWTQHGRFETIVDI